jgi:hypothetical protein
VAVAVPTIVAVAVPTVVEVAVGVPFEVEVAVEVPIIVAVEVPIMVAVEVARGVPVAVGVAVLTGVAVAVGVGGIGPLALPFNFTFDEVFPLVALLVIAIVAVDFPSITGRYVTMTDSGVVVVTVKTPVGVTPKSAAPVPVGALTVTVSGVAPLSRMVKLLVSLLVLPGNLIALKDNACGVTMSLLNGVFASAAASSGDAESFCAICN